MQIKINKTNIEILGIVLKIEYHLKNYEKSFEKIFKDFTWYEPVDEDEDDEWDLLDVTQYAIIEDDPASNRILIYDHIDKWTYAFDFFMFLFSKGFVYIGEEYIDNNNSVLIFDDNVGGKYENI